MGSRRGKGIIGESQFIFKTGSKKDKTKATRHFTEELAKRGLKPGRNPDIGPNGMRIECSGNGWEWEHNMEGHIAGITMFEHQMLMTDNWSLFHDVDLWIDPLLAKCVFPRTLSVCLKFCAFCANVSISKKNFSKWD